MSVRSEFVPRRGFDGHVIAANRHRRRFTSLCGSLVMCSSELVQLTVELCLSA